MTTIGTATSPSRVRTRSDRRRVNAITIDAYLKDARTTRQKARKDTAESQAADLGVVREKDRNVIRRGAVASTWIESVIFDGLYLTASGNAAVLILPMHRMFITPIVKLLLPAIIVVATLLLTAELAVTLHLLVAWFVVAVAVAIAGTAGSIACVIASIHMLRLHRWLKALPADGDRRRPSLRGVKHPYWLVAGLVSTQGQNLVTDLIGTINAVAPVGACVAAKARDKRLFKLYSAHLIPHGSVENMAVVGTAPLKRHAVTPTSRGM